MPSITEPSSPPANVRPRRRLAALSAIGAVVLALPLVQVLRFQADELEAVRRERAGLDPMAHAVDVQRKLLLHRDLSSLILRGQDALEPKRQLSERQVDTAVVTLSSDFRSGLWVRARDEAKALDHDWSQLKPQIAERRIAADQSDAAHRLLVEHCLQITDDLSDVLATGVKGRTGLSANTAGHRHQQMRELSHAIWRASQTVPQTLALQQAAAAAAELLQQQYTVLNHAAQQALTERETSLSRQRPVWLTATAALLVAAFGLLMQLMQPMQLLRTRRAPSDSAPLPQTVLREREPARATTHTQSVLRRMREPGRATGTPEPQDTLPPI